MQEKGERKKEKAPDILSRVQIASQDDVEPLAQRSLVTIQNDNSDALSPFSFLLSPPQALLVLVHGSPRPIANEEMFRVVEVIRERVEFPIVEVGFMECNAPDIPTGIANCIAQGAKSVTAVPYFLHTGTHVADDLPTLLEQAQEQHPQVRFAMGAYLGRSERLTDILADRIAAVSKER